MNGTSSSPQSNTVTMLGWCSDAGELRLGAEATKERGIVGQRRVQHLYRDPAPEPLVVGDVHPAAGAGADRTVQQVTAREHPAREVAANASRHGDQGSGHHVQIRGTSFLSLLSDSPRSGGCAASSVATPRLHEPGGTVPAWRYADLNIPSASPSSRLCSLIVANLAYFGTRNEVRGTASEKLPGPIVEVTPEPGEDIIPQASIVVDVLRATPARSRSTAI